MKHITVSIYNDETGEEYEWELEALSVQHDAIYEEAETHIPKVDGYSFNFYGLQALDELGNYVRITKKDFLG